MAKFTPIRLPPGQVSQQDLSRIQDAIARAISDTSDRPAVGRITSKDGSVRLTPSSGKDSGNGVDLSAFNPGDLDPGSAAITLGSNAPAGTVAGDPVKYLKVTLDGVSYVIPMWKLPGAAAIPTSGLIGWYTQTGFPTNGGGAVTGPWIDQSGNGNDLAGGFNVNTGGTYPALASYTPGNWWEFLMHKTPVTGATGGEFTIMLVLDPSGGYAGGSDMFGLAGNMNLQLQSSGLYALRVQGSPVLSCSASGPTSGYVTLLGTASTSGAVANLYIDDLSTPAATASGPPSISAINLGVGDTSGTGFGAGLNLYFEAAIWNRVLTSSERTQLKAYLDSKY